MPFRVVSALALLAALGACGGGSSGQDSDPRSVAGLPASVWIDPDGCKHWVIDDGVEGYMSSVFDKAGNPDCSGGSQRALPGDLDNLEAQIWTDPNGCQHWLLDDGAEGFMTPRRTPDGRPVCG